MTWPTLAEQTATDTVAVFGEPVTLPDGAVVLGVFNPQGRPQPDADWESGIGVAAVLARRTNPDVALLDASAAGLVRQDLLLIRGAGYRVVALEPDGAGLTRVELRGPEAVD